jgi:hypothetical protein
MTPKEKQILITHVVGKLHHELAKAGVLERCFIAMGMWMPVDHCIAAANGLPNVALDKDVSLQGLEKEYVYAEQCRRSKILAFKSQHNKEAAEEAAKKMLLESKQRAEAEALASRLAVYNAAGVNLLECIHDDLENACSSTITMLSNYVEGSFVVGGSYLAMKLLEVISSVVDSIDEPDDVPMSFLNVDYPSLEANDIDMYHGRIGDGPLVISKSENAFAHFNIPGIDKQVEEVNTVLCCNLSADGFLDNNDINAMAACIECT